MTAQNLVNTPDNRLVVAVDGPSGVGKSTLCRAVAKHFGAQYFDTGAMYRAATLAVLRAGVNPAERAAVIAATNNLNITLDDQTVLLDGEDVCEEIRSQEVTRMVSAVSAIPEVRATLIAQQREWANTTPRCIFDGRDMGTNVLPDAPLKVFLTACHKVRAQRRYEQIIASGGNTIYEVVLADVIQRDTADSMRAVDPLHPADDAIILDTSDLSLPEAIDTLISLVEESAEGGTS